MMRVKKNATAAGFLIALSFALALAGCSKQEETVMPETAEPAEQADPPALAYVSQLAGPVIIYSLADFSKRGEIAVGKGGNQIALTEDGTLLVVAVKAGAELVIVDTATQQVVRRVPLGANPEFLRVLGNKAFVASVASVPANGELQTPQVAVIDVLTGEKIKVIATEFQADGFEFSADEKNLIITHADAEKVSVYSTETGEKIEQIDTETYGVRPRAVMRSPDGDHFVIVLEYGNKMLILDKNYSVISEIATGEVPHSVTYTRDSSEIVVSLVRGKAIQVFDSETLELKREIQVGERCLHFSFSPDDLQLIVACGGGNNILVLDYVTGNVIKDMPAPNSPWGIIVTPNSAGTQHTPS